ncbi:hypothetical protein AU210_002049 [Fusarium oxysporum f. sp. radicis-cucumerinum]|uniref:NAD(P)-binding protein n=1 Tax=Fusarium oxysporum f. sp. radicis-cucumerinum TaxID=327505 RepID=A0A2H3I3F5_FUSOX|nr:hypothetical protein AU210_002049 [Fusarium oxysporum f. sp. radicis-cucumerinum]
MPSYLVTGASCGHGFGFIQVVSINPNNSLMSNKAATDKMLAEELSSPNNVHIFEADITDFNALKGAFEAVSEIAEGSLDYVIANAGLIALWSQWDAVDVLAKDPEHLVKQPQDLFNVNVIGNFHLFNLFTPLVLKGQGKKVIAISSGIEAGTSVLAAKFVARYAKEGVLFMSICPGSVDSGFEGELTEEQKEKRAFLRFEIYCRVFPADGSVPLETVSANDEFSSIEQFDLFISRLSPWEVEEIACVELYVTLMIRDYIDELESQFMSAANKYARLAWPLLPEPESEAEIKTKNE